ncbi:MAG: hypothetical protein ACW99U_17880 [Candidatus Thorarchaeota archaeon]|jgi:hypothetical protein
MRFLEKELRGLPEALQVAIKQRLESVIRELYRYYREPLSHDDPMHYEALSKISAKIYGLLDSAQGFRKILDADPENME